MPTKLGSELRLVVPSISTAAKMTPTHGTAVETGLFRPLAAGGSRSGGTHRHRMPIFALQKWMGKAKNCAPRYGRPRRAGWR